MHNFTQEIAAKRSKIFSKSSKSGKNRHFKQREQITLSMADSELLYYSQLYNAGASHSPQHIHLNLASVAIMLIGHVWYT